MSFSLGRSGDRLGISFVPSTVPKGIVSVAGYLAAWNTRTAPQPGDLVKTDATTSDAAHSDLVTQCVANDVPQYLVWSVNSSGNVSTGNSGNVWTLTCIKLIKAMSLVFEIADMSTVTLGHSIQVAGTSASAGSGTLLIGGNIRDRVKDVAFAAGSGKIVAMSAVTGVGLVVVEWPN